MTVYDIMTCSLSQKKEDNCGENSLRPLDIFY